MLFREQTIFAILLLHWQNTFIHATTRIRRPNHTQETHESRELFDTRIIGGSEAVEDRHSYVVSLRADNGHYCGGSLIAKDVVLTAAHCQTSWSTYVVVGQHDMDEYYDGEGIYVKAEHPHPNHSFVTNDNDFMLVFLDGVVENVDVVRLNSDSSVPFVDQGVTVMGWGDVFADDAIAEMSDVLMNVNVNVISNDACEASGGFVDGSYETYQNKITENMLCAKAYQRDSCQGDSGGPLVIKGEDASSDTQVGVVSWGYGCASSDFPGVYARVSQVYEWIEKEVCMNSIFASEAGFDCEFIPNDNDSAASSSGSSNERPENDDDSEVNNSGDDDDFEEWLSSLSSGNDSTSGNDQSDDDFLDYLYEFLGYEPI